MNVVGFCDKRVVLSKVQSPMSNVLFLTLDFGLWTSLAWTLDFGLWTLDCYFRPDMRLDPILLRRQMKARTPIHTVPIQQSHRRHFQRRTAAISSSGTEAPSRKLKADRACSST